jgi:hypothetical protein
MTFSASSGQIATPMLAGQEHFVLVDVEGLAHRHQDLARDRLDLFLGGDGILRQRVEEQRELVAGEAADHRVRRQGARQPLGQHLEHAVARAMAEGVVDLLEMVHVEVQQRHRRAAAQVPRDRLLQQVLELHAVRDLRQRVVAREVADAALGALAVGDVARHEDRARELRVDTVEWLGNLLPHPVTLFALFALGVVLVSGLAGWFDVERARSAARGRARAQPDGMIAPSAC